MKYKPKLGNIIVILGMTGMIVGLAAQSFSYVSRAFITIFSFSVIVLGVLLDSPILEHLKSQPDDAEFYKQTEDY